MATLASRGVVDASVKGESISEPDERWEVTV